MNPHVSNVKRLSSRGPWLFRMMLLSGFLLSGAPVLVSHSQEVKTAITPTTGTGNLGTDVAPPRTLSDAKTIHDVTGGTRTGTNLFHSFGQFSVGSNNIANFLNTPINGTLPLTTNILSRVTGENPSNIDGEIRTTDFGNANLYLLNPAGVMFGPNAILNVNGSFHVGTADSIQLGADGIFYANPNEDIKLTMAPPEAFGFLAGNPALISMEGSSLEVLMTLDPTTGQPVGQTLSLIGGDINVVDSTLLAPSGQIKIASVAKASTNTEVIAPDQGPKLQVNNPERLGQITLVGAELDVSDNDFEGNGKGGSVVIRSGHLMIREESVIFANTFGDVDGASPGIELNVAEGITITDEAELIAETGDLGDEVGNGGVVTITTASLAMMNDAGISTATIGKGKAGDISLNVDSLALEGGAEINSQGGNVAVRGLTGEGSAADLVTISDPGSGLVSDNFSSVKGGRLAVSARSLTVSDGGTITSGAGDVGPGGDIVVIVQRLRLSTDAPITTESDGLSRDAQGGDIMVTATDSAVISGGASIFSTSDSTRGASPGDISVHVGTLSLMDGAVIQSGDILGQGLGGNVVVQGPTGASSAADSVTISNGSRISSAAFTFDAGQVTLSATDLTLDNASSIETSTNTAGNAGIISLNIGNATLIDGSRIDSSSMITATGAAGSVTVQGPGGTGTKADAVIIAGQDSADNPSGIFTTSEGKGAGGNIEVMANTVTLNDGATISAESTGTGLAGDILIQVADTFRAQNGSSVTVETTQSDAGDINFEVGTLVHLRNQSKISTSAADGKGNGGDITIDPLFVVLDGASQIIAKALEGSGGNITIRISGGGDFLKSPDSIVSAASEFGVGGAVEIDSPDQDLAAAMIILDASFLDVSGLLRERCSAAAVRERSSFTVASRGGVPRAPNAYFPSALQDIQGPVQSSKNAHKGSVPVILLSRNESPLHERIAKLGCLQN